MGITIITAGRSCWEIRPLSASPIAETTSELVLKYEGFTVCRDDGLQAMGKNLNQLGCGINAESTRVIVTAPLSALVTTEVSFLDTVSNTEMSEDEDFAR
jgi:hypothetical protein